MRRALRILLGTAFWLGLLSCLTGFLTHERSSGTSTATDLGRFILRREFRFDVRFEQPVRVEVGDAVHLEGGDGVPVGEICALLDEDREPLEALVAPVRAARVRCFDRSRPLLHTDARVRLVLAPDTAVWTIHTLLTPKTLPLVKEEWSRTWPVIRERLTTTLRPILRDVIGDCEQIIQKEAGPFIRRHRPEGERLLEKLEEELGDEKLAQLFEEEVWPIVKKHLEPVTDRIGQELWSRVPLWGFTWRLAYQSLPLTRDDYFEERWSRFVKQEVAPIVKSHAGDLIDASKKISRETLSSKRVTSELRSAILHLLSDPEFHLLAQLFLQEVFIDNPEFRERMKARWQSPAVQRAVQFISTQLEASVRRMADIVLGTRESGITPEFARVLRAQILQKDARRLLVDPGNDGAPLLQEGVLLEAPVEWERPEARRGSKEP